MKEETLLVPGTLAWIWRRGQEEEESGMPDFLGQKQDWGDRWLPAKLGNPARGTVPLRQRE